MHRSFPQKPIKRPVGGKPSPSLCPQKRVLRLRLPPVAIHKCLKFRVPKVQFSFKVVDARIDACPGNSKLIFRLRLSMLVSMLVLETRISGFQPPVSIPDSRPTNKIRLRPIPASRPTNKCVIRRRIDGLLQLGNSCSLYALY